MFRINKFAFFRDALLDICRRKGVDLGTSNVFLDANKSPLPCLDIETSWMGGKHIRIKVNDRVTNLNKKDLKNSFAPPIPLRKISSVRFFFYFMFFFFFLYTNSSKQFPLDCLLYPSLFFLFLLFRV